MYQESSPKLNCKQKWNEWLLMFLSFYPQDSVYGMSRVAGSGSSLSSEETAYVRVVRQYNEEILQGGIRPNLAEALSEAASSMNDQVGVEAG